MGVLIPLLSRAAQLDCERGRHDAESRRAQEALEYASLLHRVTEMALASAILACTSRANNELEAVAQHDASMAALEADGVAEWAPSITARTQPKKGPHRNDRYVSRARV